MFVVKNNSYKYVFYILFFIIIVIPAFITIKNITVDAYHWITHTEDSKTKIERLNNNNKALTGALDQYKKNVVIEHNRANIELNVTKIERDKIKELDAKTDRVIEKLKSEEVNDSVRRDRKVHIDEDAYEKAGYSTINALNSMYRELSKY